MANTDQSYVSSFKANLLGTSLGLGLISVGSLLVGGMMLWPTLKLMDKFNGAEESWHDAFVPIYVMLAAVTFFSGFAIFCTFVKDSFLGALCGFFAGVVVIGGILAAFVFQPLFYLGDYLDDSSSINVATFLWIYWFGGVAVTKIRGLVINCMIL